MPFFQYKARDKFGKSVAGGMKGDSGSAVALRLKQMGYVPVFVREVREGPGRGGFLPPWRAVKAGDVNMFTRQLFILERAGLPLLASFAAIRDQTVNVVFKNTLGDISKEIEKGASLSLALERHPEIFNPLYVSMVRSGEASGKMSEILERLATLGEREEDIRLRVQAATRYPIIVVVAMLGAFLLLTAMVVPRFSAIYGSFAVELPLPTRILFGMQRAMSHYLWITLLVIGGAVFLVRRLIRSKRGRLFWDAAKLKIPIFGPLLMKFAMSRFSHITAILMKSGVPILQILDLVAAGAGNAVLSRTLENIKKNVNEGRGMLEPMKASGMFPPIVTQMVAVGEETGRLAELLLHVSDYYDSQVDYIIGNLVSLIEPILIFVLGCGVLFMALAIFLPMWNMMSLFKSV